MSKTETFNSFLARVFPDEHIDITKIAGNHVYNITF